MSIDAKTCESCGAIAVHAYVCSSAPREHPIERRVPPAQPPEFGTLASSATLRDHFAAMVLQGIWASESYGGENFDRIAEIAYRMADAMLAERAK